MRAAGCEALGGRRRARRHGPDRTAAPSAAAAAPARGCSRRASRAARPHVFVGIDAPEFNLGLAEAPASSAGIKTVQYVSPQVWAWRQGRVRTIAAACDLVLCLLPFETDFYARMACGPNSSAIRWPTRFRWSQTAQRRAPALESARGRHRRRAAAGQPPGRGRAPGRRFRRRRRLARRVAGPDCGSLRPWPRAASVQASSRAQRAQVPPALLRFTLLDGQAQPALTAADGVSWPPEPRPSRHCCRGVHGGGLPFSALTAFLLRRLGLVKVPYFRNPTCWPDGAGARVPAGAGQRGGAGRALLQQLTDATGRGELQREFRNVHRSCAAAVPTRAADAMLQPACGARVRRSADARVRDGLQRSCRVAGVDEAGRGPLAGPVVAAAVILDPRRRIAGLATPRCSRRRARAPGGASSARARWAGRSAGPDRDEIDSLNILQATLPRDAPRAAGSAGVPDAHQVDGNQLPAPGGSAPSAARSSHHRRRCARALPSAPLRFSPKPAATP